MTQSDGSITVYSDYICPFCYLGRRSLAAYQATREQPLKIDWRPFDLRSQKRGPDAEIDHSVDDGKNTAYYDRVQQDVTRLQQEYDADEMLTLAELPDTLDSFDTQLASCYVKQAYPDRWLAVDERIFEVLWVEGRDIGDHDVLTEIAATADIDGTELRAAIRDEDRRERLRTAFRDARQAGVSGVPTFVYGDHSARGAVPPEQIARLVDGPSSQPA